MIDSEEAVEDAFEMLGGNAGTGVAHAHPNLTAIALQRKNHGAARGVAHRVRCQIQENVARAVSIADGLQAGRWLGAHDKRFVHRHRFGDLTNFLDDGGQIERGMSEG